MGNQIFDRVKESLHSKMHWQNLDSRVGDGFESTGRLWKHGRAWFRLFDIENPGIRLEWNLGSKFCHLGFSIDVEESEVLWKIAVPPVAVWVSIENLRKFFDFLNVRPWNEPGGWKSYQKDIQISYHDGCFHWVFWYDDSHWSREMARWRSGHFNLIDFVFGRTEHSEKTVKGPIEVSIPMPERSYKCLIEMKRETWKRPRLFWNSDEVLRAHVDMEGDPIPHPGKGTTDYNCGETATYSSTLPAKSIADAIGKVVGSIMDSRIRYGHLGWVPKNHTETQADDSL